MNSESVDLIYLDPPFNSQTNYAAPIGSEAAGAEFKDTWTLDDVDVEWIYLIGQRHPTLRRVLLAAMTNSDKSYLAYMAARILEMRRVLKPTGSIYLHCDPTMSHYLKLVMDSLFGKENFRNEIVWGYRTGGASKRHFAKKHDVILFYSRGDGYRFNAMKEKAYTKSKHRKPGVINYGAGTAEFHEDSRGVYNLVSVRDVWEIPYLNSQAKERTGYPTQKPLALLERIIKASSNEGDVVFDPFCGCATTLVAADRLQRKWVGIDVSAKAVELVKRRIKKDQGLFQHITPRTDIPQRTDLGKLPRANSPQNKKNLYGEQGGHCAGCETHYQYKDLEVDHIIAVSKGGTDHIDNLQLLCGSCNRIKGNRGMEYLKTELQL